MRGGLKFEVGFPSAEQQYQQTKKKSLCKITTGIRRSTGAAGERENSKTPGGIKYFTHKETAYRKWMLNDPIYICHGFLSSGTRQPR